MWGHAAWARPDHFAIILGSFCDPFGRLDRIVRKLGDLEQQQRRYQQIADDARDQLDEEGWREAQVSLGMLRMAAALYKRRHGDRRDPGPPLRSPAVFAALADPKRLILVGLLAERPRYVEALAETLALSPSTVSFHLKKLREAGLVTATREQYYLNYTLRPGWLERSLGSLIRAERLPRQALERREQAYRQRVLSRCFEHGRLLEIPRRRKRRQIVLEQLADLFEPDRAYHEQEVDKLLGAFFTDACALRCALVDERLLARAQDTYTRVSQPPPRLPG